MEHAFAKLAAAVEPFHHLDFSVWFSFALGQKPLALGMLIAVGLFCALVGTRHPFDRGTAPLVGLFFGLLVAPDLQAVIDPYAHVTLKLVSMALPVVLVLLGAFVPYAIVFVVAGTLGGAIGAGFAPEKDLLLGLIPGFLVVGSLGTLMGRYLLTVITAWVGSVMATGGLLALLADNAVGRLLASSAYGPLAVAILLTISGAALQFATYQDDGQRRDKRVAQREKKQLDKEARERQARFAGYRR